MRHNKSGKKLGRNSAWRKATVRDIARATLIHERICTTYTKAKEARKLVDQLVTLGKKQTLAAKRRAFEILCDHALVKDLFHRTEMSFKNRQGGYSRIIPLAQTRRGDNARLVFLELTEKIKKISGKKSDHKKIVKAPKVLETSKEEPAELTEAQKIKEKETFSSKKELTAEKPSKKIGRSIKAIFKKRTSDK